MRLYALALLVATSVSFTFVAGKYFTGKVPQVERLEAAAKEPEVLEKEKIRVVAVSPTPEPETALIAIQYPKEDAVIDGNPVWLQVRVNGYSLGSDSDFDRSDEIFDSNLGQTLHVIIDNKPYFPINGPSVQPFNESGFYYNQNYRFKVPEKLSEGFHTVRVFPARSYGESLKGEKTFQASYFYVGSKGSGSQTDELSKPYLTYNEPSDQIRYKEEVPILLDFYLSNCDLSPDGYKVRLSVDGKNQRILTSWQPYYIYGLPKGTHTVLLELIDSSKKAVPGLFNNNMRKIVVD